MYIYIYIYIYMYIYIYIYVYIYIYIYVYIYIYILTWISISAFPTFVEVSLQKFCIKRNSDWGAILSQNIDQIFLTGPFG